MSRSNCLSSKTSQCTILCHPCCMKTTPVHQRLETPTETDTQEHVYQKPVRDVSELKQHLIEMWSATSRAMLIKRLISSDNISMRLSKPKANSCCETSGRRINSVEHSAIWDSVVTFVDSVSSTTEDVSISEIIPWCPILWWLRLRRPRNNICYSGHVKYFSDWLIDWLFIRRIRGYSTHTSRHFACNEPNPEMSLHASRSITDVSKLRLAV